MNEKGIPVFWAVTRGLPYRIMFVLFSFFVFRIKLPSLGLGVTFIRSQLYDSRMSKAEKGGQETK